MISIVRQPDNLTQFLEKALVYASTFKHCCYLNSNEFKDEYSSFDALLGMGNSSIPLNSLEELKTYRKQHSTHLLGYWGYDLKNEIETLFSTNPDYLSFPELDFFEPEYLLVLKNGQVHISSTETNPELIFEKINCTPIPFAEPTPAIKLNQRIPKEKYLNIIRVIRGHIEEGDVYELNFCMEFYAENIKIDPLTTYKRLNERSPMPFSTYLKMGDKYVMGASPERFLQLKGNTLISQPIKGTAKRSTDLKQDAEIKELLRNDPKEQAENIMIVDLVRNDLTRSAKTGSIQVKELFGVYSFKQVHQLISTISAEKRDDVDTIDILKNTFPMGSMTGAPKIKAMQLIEKYEQSKRGLFSGSIGYINPEGDFDFNVVIRSIMYNAATGYLSFQVGSAITYDSIPEKEYEECLLKAKAMMEVLENQHGCESESGI